MVKVNENFLEVKQSYLFSEIAKRIDEYKKKNPDADIIKLGIGDVTLPIVPKVIETMHKALDEMGKKETFRGYGPEQGYDFLREKIAEFDYKRKGIDIDISEIFVSDGAKCDTGNIVDILGTDNVVAITDPVYPVYLDTNIMAGRKKIVYMKSTKENNFVPEIPKERVDIIYICMPNNPTGTTLKKDELKKFVDYAIENKSLILFDSAYEAFIVDEDVPHSIYEIEGAKKVAIEFRSFSKTAGFTGVRCAYAVVPKELCAYTKEGKEVALNPLWNRRQCTKFNGVPYVTQRGAEAVYTEEGQKQIKENIKYYQRNARIIKEGLKKAGYEVYGGDNAPYVWLKVPDGLTSWEFFDKLLEEKKVVGTPGVGFGDAGEGYFRLTAFGSYENTVKAIERICGTSL